MNAAGVPDDWSPTVLLAADYPFMDILWTMIIFFCWVAWIMIVIQIFGDLFRRDDTSGWSKAFWTLFIILVPFLGVLVYLIANSSGMAQRQLERSRQAQAQFADYVQSVAAPANGSASELAQAKSLLDSGTISQREFDTLKTKILA